MLGFYDFGRRRVALCGRLGMPRLFRSLLRTVRVVFGGVGNKGQRLIFAGFGSRNSEICRAFRGRLLFRHVVRSFGLENIKRQRGHYTLSLFFGAADFMKKLCLCGCWRDVPYGLRYLELSRVVGAAVAVECARASGEGVFWVVCWSLKRLNCGQSDREHIFRASLRGLSDMRVRL